MTCWPFSHGRQDREVYRAVARSTRLPLKIFLTGGKRKITKKKTRIKEGQARERAGSSLGRAGRKSSDMGPAEDTQPGAGLSERTESETAPGSPEQRAKRILDKNERKYSSAGGGAISFVFCVSLWIEAGLQIYLIYWPHPPS